MVSPSSPLASVRLFVLDLDGTVCLGDRLLPGVLPFLRRVRETGRRALFFTNNTSESPGEHLRKLGRMGVPAARRDLMTAADVTIRFLKRHRPGKRVYLIGVPSLRDSLLGAGIPLVESEPDIVLVGFDRTLTYEKLERGCVFLRRGAEFLATHPDVNCPTGAEPVPDCGAITAAMERATGRRPRALGKPAPETVEAIVEATGVPKEALAFVGDRLYTDVAAGIRNGARGFLVLTGETGAADLADAVHRPDAVFDSLGSIASRL